MRHSRGRGELSGQFWWLGLACLPALYAGWRFFWFLTDDAFISFRYVSNSMSGLGYVWNPPPFLPVEGYTNFLWVVLLDIVWRLFGVQPPVSANWLSLAFSAGTLCVVIGMGARLDLGRQLSAHRHLFLALALLGTLANRTFLAWTSSGLETAMFNFFVTLWLYACIFVQPETLRWPWLLATSSSLAALTRPDGLLLWGISLALLVIAARRCRGPVRFWQALGALPAALVPLHLVWRRVTYGAWLPNTYYAKISSPWPESGTRYFLSFALEYALWFFLLLGTLALLRGGRTAHAAGATDDCRRGRRRLGELWRDVETSHLAAGAAGAALLLHFLLYTFVAGGDHFEYRVYSHLVPLFMLSAVWMLGRGGLRTGPAAALLALFIGLSAVIPWTHWAATQQYTTRERTFRLKEPVAPHLPKAVAWYGRLFDDLQSWLIDRSVCMRHQEHKVFWQSQIETFPSREEGLRLRADNYPVRTERGVGVPAWVMPTVNIIDLLGLNDYVIARTPVDLARNYDQTNPQGLRQMAHDRRSPPGYLEGFKENVIVGTIKGKPHLYVMRRPMSAQAIIGHERTWRQAADSVQGAE